MRVFLVFILFIIISCKESEKKPEIKVLSQSIHSAAFNQAIDSTLLAYDKMADAFVKWDSVRIPGLAVNLEKAIKTIDTAEGKGESQRFDSVHHHLAIIEGSQPLQEKRHALNSLTGHLFEYLRSVKYDRKELFLQVCPMAFNDTGSGLWISGADSIKNPYLGMHHPKYGKGMLKCGENKDRINFTGISNDEEEIDKP